jgi:hypothetical protein
LDRFPPVVAQKLKVKIKSSQVNTLPKAKSQAKDKRAKDRQIRAHHSPAFTFSQTNFFLAAICSAKKMVWKRQALGRRAHHYSAAPQKSQTVCDRAGR